MNIARLVRNAAKRTYSSSRAALSPLDPLQRASLQENCILVNANDTAIGSASKYDCHRVSPDGDIPLHRAFSVFLFNSDRELLLQKRSDAKITFPGHITNTCCSHPLSDVNGESDGISGVKLAAQRRLIYELGLPKDSIRPEDMTYLTRLIYKSKGDGVWGEHEIDYILFIVGKDLPMTPNPNEVSRLFYISQGQFDNYLGNLCDPVTPWFRLIASNWLQKWWGNLDNLRSFQDHKRIHGFEGYSE